MMKANRVKSEKFHGVYIHKSAVRQEDEAYYIHYRDKNGRLCWERVGWKNEGYTEEEASRVRSARIHEIRHRRELLIHEPEILDSSSSAKKNLPEGELIKEHIDQISRVLTEMNLEWLKPYIFTAIGLFKGIAHPQPKPGADNEANNDPDNDPSMEWNGVSLETFMSGIELFRNEISRELSLQDIHMILLAIANDGISLIDYRKLLGISPNALSRSLKKLGSSRNQDLDGTWKDVGYDMIETCRASNCRKMKLVSLTKRGKQFAEKLKRVLATGEVPVRPMAPHE